jgi:hypothetical protein
MDPLLIPFLPLYACSCCQREGLEDNTPSFPISSGHTLSSLALISSQAKDRQPKDHFLSCQDIFSFSHSTYDLAFPFPPRVNFRKGMESQAP